MAEQSQGPELEESLSRDAQQNEMVVYDHGLRAWIQVFGTFWLWLNTWGLTNAFGVFQSYYTIKFPNQKPALIALIGCIQPFVLIFFGFLAGPLWDAGYSRSLIFGGTCLTALGYFMVSICDQYWQVMLAQGLLTGFGSCFLFVPAIAIIPQYFDRRKAIANGIAASGSGLGGVIYPIAFRQLLQRLSFGWSVRVLAFIVLGTCSLSLVTIQARSPKGGKRTFGFDYKAFAQNPPYGAYTLAAVFCLAAQYTPAFFIQDYALDKGIMDENLASYLLPILNACSILGRIAPNIIADRIGGLNVLIPAIFIAMVLAFSWISISTVTGCIIFSCLYGLSVGCILSLPPFVIASLCKDPNVIGSRLGNSFAVSSLGLLMGPPIAAVILQSGSWIGTQLFAGCILTAALLALIFARTFIAGPRLLVKV